MIITSFWKYPMNEVLDSFLFLLYFNYIILVSSEGILTLEVMAELNSQGLGCKPQTILGLARPLASLSGSLLVYCLICILVKY